MGAPHIEEAKEPHKDEVLGSINSAAVHTRSLSFVAEHPITFLVRHRVREDKVPAFLNFVEGVAKAASSFPGYVAHTVIPPTASRLITPSGVPRVVTYLSVLKFAARRDFQRWIDSAERAKLLQQAADAEVFQEIDWDLKEGTLTIINRGLMLEDEENDAGAVKPAAQEPPKWKFCVLVILVLLAVQMLDRFAILPLLLRTPLKRRPLDLYLVNTFMVVTLLSYLGLPIASRLVRPLMRPVRWLPPRLTFLYKLEPFRSLSQGLPCFRPPRETAPHVELGRYIRSLEAAIDRVADTNLRLQDRLERLEELHQGPLGVATEAELEQQELDQLLDMEDGHAPVEVYEEANGPVDVAGRQKAGKPATANGDGNGDGNGNEDGELARGRRLAKRHPSLDLTHVLPPNWPAEKQPMAAAWEEEVGEGGVRRDFVEEAIEQASQDAYAPGAQVTVVVSVHVPPTQFGRFEDFIRAITKSALVIPGYYGATLLRPRRGTCMYVVLHRFQTVVGAKAFARCQRRKELVQRLLPSLALQPPTVRVEVEKTVLGELFRAAAADSTTTEKVRGRGPQRWKMAVVLYFCVVCTQYPLLHSAAYRRLLPTIARPIPPVSALLATNCLVVGLVVYVTLPLALVLMQRWVFAPWKESNFTPLRILQTGIPCLM